MKKYTFILFFLVFVLSMNALQLTRYYHRNYNLVDRSVFVFNEQPDFFLNEASDHLEITVNNCSLAPDVNDQVLDNNPVLSSYAFADQEAALKITIGLNRPLQETRKYRAEDFLLSGNMYKLVIDIFKYAEPASKEEISSYIGFYRKVELKKEAAAYEQMLADWKEPAAENIDEVPASSDTDTETGEETIDDELQSEEIETEDKLKIQDIWVSIKELYNSIPSLYLIIAAALILAIIVLIVIIVKLKKKAKVQDIFHNKEKLGSKAFRAKVIKILKEADWEDNMIAEELGISVDEVKNSPK